MSSLGKKILSFLMVAAFLAAGFGVSGSLNDKREKFGLTRLELADQARPDLLTNVMLSVGRALLVDYLWIGLQKMQEDGRYFDAMQRAKWVSQLQPHFPSVWIFQAWNMSYNISVAMTSGEDRWRWVKNGYELLRDQGIALNPKSIGLYQQLAWIFFHKIGALSDDFHWYYKIQMARSLEPIVGSPLTREYYDMMAQAPATWETLLDVPKMKEFLAALETFKIDPRADFLELPAKRDELGEKVLAVLDDPGYAQCRRRLEGFVRAERLYNEWKLEIKIVDELRRADMYGPLDFRIPQAHAIYWVYKGLKTVGGDVSFDGLSNLMEGDDSFDARNAKRVIYGALQDIVKRGRFVISEEGMPLISPDIRFVPVANRVYLALGKADAETEGVEWDGTAGNVHKSGHINFLRKAIALFYQYGREDLARKYWDELNRLYPNREYRIGMQNYIYKYVLEDVSGMSMVDVNATVKFFLVQAYQRYAMGDDYAALAMERLARTVYDAHRKEHHRLTDRQDRMNLADWDALKKDVETIALKRLPPKLKDRLKKRLGITEAPQAPTPK